MLLLARQRYNVFMVTSSNKKTKEQLINDLGSLQSALQHVMSGVIITDENGVIDFVNNKWLTIHGAQGDGVVGKSLFALHQSGTGVSLKYQLAKALEGEEVVDTMDHLLPNGQQIWLWVHCRLVDLDKKDEKKVMWSVQDISDQKRIEQKLQKQNNKLRTLNKLMVGRELELVKLKKQVKELESIAELQTKKQ